MQLFATTSRCLTKKIMVVVYTKVLFLAHFTMLAPNDYET